MVIKFAFTKYRNIESLMEIDIFAVQLQRSLRINLNQNISIFMMELKKLAKKMKDFSIK